MGVGPGTDQRRKPPDWKPVSHEWIYRYVAADKARGGKLYQRFRQGRKRYRKGVNSKRPLVPNPRSVEDRPVVVETRERFEGWELDTVPGKHGTGALVTLAERKSRMCLVKRIDAKRAVNVRGAVIQMLKEPLIKSGAGRLR